MSQGHHVGTVEDPPTALPTSAPGRLSASASNTAQIWGLARTEVTRMCGCFPHWGLAATSQDPYPRGCPFPGPLAHYYGPPLPQVYMGTLKSPLHSAQATGPSSASIQPCRAAGYRARSCKSDLPSAASLVIAQECGVQRPMRAAPRSKAGPAHSG